jgi:hypothetical protein
VGSFREVVRVFRVAGAAGSDNSKLRCSYRRAGSESLAFLAPSTTFAVAGRAPEGFPTRQPAPTEIGTDGPHDLGLLFEALPRALPPPLGWAPLMGLASAPPPTSPARVHSREQAPFGPALPSNRTCSALVVSHHLDGLLRAQARGFVAPRSQPGVRRVLDPPEPVPSEDGSGPPGALPATRVHTLRRVSLADSRHRITAAPCPRAVTCTVLPSTATEAATTLPVPANREPRGLRRGSLAQAAISSTVKLRSAEADPHVTDARLTAGEPASSEQEPPPRCHRSGAQADGRVPAGMVSHRS